MERVCLCFSASVYSAGWYRVCIPRRWLPVVCTSYTYPAGSEDLVVLAVMDCWRERFNIRLTGITGLKLGLGLRGRGNALVENGKKRNDPTDKPELWRCVCGMFSVKRRAIAHVMLLGQRKQIRSWASAGKKDPITFIKTSVRYLQLGLLLCVCYGGKSICVFVWLDLTLLCVCVAIFHVESFLKISTLPNCSCLSKMQAGIRWVNMSTV